MHVTHDHPFEDCPSVEPTCPLSPQDGQGICGGCNGSENNPWFAQALNTDSEQKTTIQSRVG